MPRKDESRRLGETRFRVDRGGGPIASRHAQFVCDVAAHEVDRVRRHFELRRAFDFLSNTDDAVFVVDRDQHIVLWNLGAERLLGFGKSDVLGRCCFDVLGGCEENGASFCRECCWVQQCVRAGKTVPTRNVLVKTKATSRLLVSATTIAFPSLWLAHLLRGESAHARSRPSLELISNA